MLSSNAEIWAQLDSLAEGYAARQGAPADRLVVGHAIAAMLKSPDDSPGHPLHTHWVRPVAPMDALSGVWFPDQPVQERHWWDQWLRERVCRKYVGGHWWHPANAMIAWFCCICGKERDGMPKDGT